MIQKALDTKSFLMGNRADTERTRYPRWLWVFIGVTLVLTSIPYWLGFASQGEAWHFTGFVIGVEDGNSYIAKMLRGAAGEWLFRTPYTALPQAGVLVYLPYILLGKLSALPGQHEQLVALYQLFRLIAGALSILASYDFLAMFIRDERWRRWGLILIIWGGGLGWITLFFGRADWLGSLPLEMYSPDTFGFLALFGLPHLALARALLLWGLRAYLFPEVVPHGANPGIFVGLLWLLMGLLQPLTVALAWAILFSYLVLLTVRHIWLTWKKDANSNRLIIIHWWQRSALVVLVSAPIVVYTLWVFNSDPVLKLWQTQNQILSPHPAHYGLAYGLMYPFAALGVRSLLKEHSDKPWLLIAWTLALPFLVYAPYPLQRRLADGYWVALVILALVSFERIQSSTFQRLRWLLILSIPSSMILVFGASQQVIKPDIPIFRPNAEVEAFNYFQQTVEVDDVLLAAYNTANAAPAWAALYVVIGHGPESVGLAELRPRVEDFYQQRTSDADRFALIEEFGIDYIFWGPHERALGDWNPEDAQNLEILYNQDEITIYRVLP